MECERCGRQTNNSGIDGTAIQGPGPLDEFNGIVWLCDEHLEEFSEWLEGEPEPGEHLVSIEGEVNTTGSWEAKGIVSADIDYDVPQLLFDVFGSEELEEVLADSDPTWDVRMVPGEVEEENDG